MEWLADLSWVWELVKVLIPILILLFGLQKILKEVVEAIGASAKATTEAVEWQNAVRDMIEDGELTDEERALVEKEFKEMVEAGKVAAKEWQDVYWAIVDKIKEVR